MRALFVTTICVFAITASAAVKQSASPPPNKDVKQKPLSLVRVNVTGQVGNGRFGDKSKLR